MDISLPVSTVVGGLLGLWLVVLSANVIRLRWSTGVSLGTGDDRQLTRAVRAQGNLTEYAPVFMILLAVVEVQGGNGTWLWLVSTLFVVGRLGHGLALGFTKSFVAGRIAGMGASLTALVLMALTALVALAT